SGEGADVPATAEPPMHDALDRSLAGPRPAPTGALSPDLNVEVIQDLIKKLADELNGPADRAAEGPEPGVTAEAMLARSVAALDRGDTAGGPGGRPRVGPPGPGGSGGANPPPPGPEAARIGGGGAPGRFGGLVGPVPVPGGGASAPLRGQHAPAHGRRRVDGA